MIGLYICSECGGWDVEYMVWYNPNTDKVTDSTVNDNISQCWCRDCNENETIFYKEFKNEDEIKKYKVINKLS